MERAAKLRLTASKEKEKSSGVGEVIIIGKSKGGFLPGPDFGGDSL